MYVDMCYYVTSILEVGASLGAPPYKISTPDSKVAISIY